MAMITWHQAGWDGIEHQYHIEGTVHRSTTGKTDGHPDDAVAPEGVRVEDLTIKRMNGTELESGEWAEAGFDVEILEHVEACLIEEDLRTP